MMEDESVGAALADLAFYHAPFVIGADTELEYAEKLEPQRNISTLHGSPVQQLCPHVRR